MLSSLPSTSVRVRVLRSFCNHRRWKSSLKSDPKESFCARALKHFDDFYSKVYASRWPSIRLGLLCSNKRCVVVNIHGDKERVVSFFQSEGAQNIRKLFENNKKYMQEKGNLETATSVNVYKLDDKLDEILNEKQRADIESVYPEKADIETVAAFSEQFKPKKVMPKTEDEDDIAPVSTKVSDDPSIHTPLSESLRDADLDVSRLITPSHTGARLGASLYEFIPATRLKGMEDYTTESSHYNYFNAPSDFPVEIESEDDINFPRQLDIFAYERGNCLEFPAPGKSSCNVIDFQECDLGMLPPVLALGLNPGDTVLDMLSTEDSTLLLTQAFIAESVVTNANKAFRKRDIQKLLNNLFFEDRADIIHLNPLAIEGSYKKILVCVPCTKDRSSVQDEKDNIFNPSVNKNRLQLPETQADLLCKALELVEEGGTVVYCTRTLSPIQNDGVVHMALRKIWHEKQCRFVVRDLTRGLQPLQSLMEIVPSVKYGHVILPFLPNNCGPIYFCKLEKDVQVSRDVDLEQ